MSNLRRASGSRLLFDITTGAFAGVTDSNGNESLVSVLSPAQTTAVLAGGSVVVLNAAKTGLVDSSGTVTNFGNGTTGTVAQMLAVASPVRGQRFYTTDSQTLNGAQGAGNDWIYDGSQWRPNGYQRIIADTTLVSGAVQTAEQALKTLSIPAGLLWKQRFIVSWLVAKTGSADVMNKTALYFGTAGTLADQQVAVSSTTVLGAAKMNVGAELMFESVSATSIQRRGTSGQVDNGDWIFSAAATPAQAAATVADHQAGICKLTLSVGMATAGGDVPKVGEVFVTLVP